MKHLPRRWTPLLLVPLLLSTFACQAANQAWQAVFVPSPTATQTALPSATPTLTPSPTATNTPTPTATPTPSATPTPRPTASPLHLQVFEELWLSVREDYLYPDYNGLDWEAVGEEYRRRIQMGLSNEAFYAAMDEMIYRLGDEHSVFLSPQEAAEDDATFTEGFDYVGIGILNNEVTERQRLTIILVFPDSPAAEAGLAPRDAILEVDGQPVVDEQGVRQSLLRGPSGSTMTLTVQSPGEAPRQVTLIRRQVSGSMPVPYEAIQSAQGKRIGYLLLATFYDDLVDEKVEDALREMSAAGRLDGLILDNRFNEGGANTVFGNTLGYFTSGLVGYFTSRAFDEPLRVIGEDVEGSQELPLVVLVGEDTVSFGEIFSGILQDIGRAYLIGERTEGNVEILWGYSFSDGSRAWIAHDSFRPLNNPERNWEQNGVIPDLEVVNLWDLSSLEDDPAVRAALEYFDAQ